jgi:hypothetical protein
MDRTDLPTAPALDALGAACARAAGLAGIAANGLLAGFFAFRGAGSSAGELLGPANDLVGSLASGLMIPVALSVRRLLPEGRAIGTVQALGLASMGVLTVSGPLLVLGVMPFQTSTAITLGAAMVLAGWLLAVNRWMRRRGTLRPELARLGEVVGAATLAAGAVAASGWVLLPQGSTTQVVVLVLAGVPGVLAWIATPVWFLRLGSRPVAPSMQPSMQGATP